ncbi:MAG: serine hydrolase domain-containing protein [Oscillospiraceae bacterium]
MTKCFKKRLTAAFAAVVFAASVSSCGEKNNSRENSSVGENKQSATDTARFAKAVDEYLLAADFKGAVLVSVGDEIIFEGGYGLSDEKDPDSEKVGVHSTFEIGSMTKQMTAACILMQEEKGLLDTSDTLAEYFPDWKYADEVTIDMLLHMRSGLSDPINDPDSFFPAEVSERVKAAELECTPLEDDIVMQYFYDAPLKSTPDERMDYCNMNYYLLACIVEQTSGISFDEYVKANIFEPCEMTDSNLDFQGTSTKAYDSAGRYYSIPKPLAKGSGEINSSVRDLFKWNRALYSGELLGGGALEKMLTSTDGYACGLFTNSVSSYHGGLTDVYNSYGEHYNDDDFLIIVLDNSGRSLATAAAGNIRRIYSGE